MFYKTAREIWNATKETYSDKENTSKLFEIEGALHELRQGDFWWHNISMFSLGDGSNLKLWKVSVLMIGIAPVMQQDTKWFSKKTEHLNSSWDCIRVLMKFVVVSWGQNPSHISKKSFLKPDVKKVGENWCLVHQAVKLQRWFVRGSSSSKRKA